MIGYLFEIGPASSTGMGSAPIAFLEILAWMSLTGIALTAWEARSLRRLSVEYVSESRKAEKIDAQPPWKAPDAKPVPTALQLSLRALAKE